MIFDGSLLIGPNVTIQFAKDRGIIVKNGGLLRIDKSVLQAQTDAWGGIALDTSNETIISDSMLSEAVNGITVKSSGNLSINGSSLKDMLSVAVHVESPSNQDITLSNVVIDQSGYGIYAPSFQGYLSLINSSITNITEYGEFKMLIIQSSSLPRPS